MEASLEHAFALTLAIVQWTGKACEGDGIKFEVRNVDKLELEDKLKECIADPKIHGIMIYYPCFGLAPSFYGGSMDDYLRDSIPVEKDVEGLCDTVSSSHTVLDPLLHSWLQERTHTPGRI